MRKSKRDKTLLIHNLISAISILHLSAVSSTFIASLIFNNFLNTYNGPDDRRQVFNAHLMMRRIEKE